MRCQSVSKRFRSDWCRYNFEKKQERLIGKHKAAVSCVLYVESLRKTNGINSRVEYIISSSWDKTVKIWDAKAETPNEPLFELPQTHKAYTMDISSDMYEFYPQLTLGNFWSLWTTATL